MAGILLKRQGHHVHILEQAISSEREGQAAGIGLSAAAKAFFDEHDRLAHIPMSVEIRSLAFFDPKTMKVARQFPYKGGLTSWEFCYARLRANFDGMKSAYCPEPPDLSVDAGTGVFESGKRVVDVASRGEKLVITAEGLESGITYTYTADIVVVADGANSSMRKQMQPLVRRETPGYVLWRGVVPTSSLSQECVDLIGDNTVSYPMKYSYAIIYNIPGPTGSVKDGERYINFAWYYWPPSKQETQEILTDTDGHIHRTTLPKGKMRSEIWAAQLEIARNWMPPLIAEIPAKIEHPFVSLISSISAKQARFFDDRLFFIGDALVQVPAECWVRSHQSGEGGHAAPTGARRKSVCCGLGAAGSYSRGGRKVIQQILWVLQSPHVVVGVRWRLAQVCGVHGEAEAQSTMGGSMELEHCEFQK
ncbi:hypothetical protein LTR56_019445 [Elasticomyces elasticus]|nr:hypothetical protein LTR56_019445 [Elasticomyces elasticus]KAK3634739.1 hypothetical protein LTR22_019500 [Elasticomyces elasticus]KAK5750812.1 hypothetical protein LTS12_019100 [Elasticomyces elasticus]